MQKVTIQYVGYKLNGTQFSVKIKLDKPHKTNPIMNP
jgi:hypothetical protein